MSEDKHALTEICGFCAQPYGADPVGYCRHEDTHLRVQRNALTAELERKSTAYERIIDEKADMLVAMTNERNALIAELAQARKEASDAKAFWRGWFEDAAQKAIDTTPEGREFLAQLAKVKADRDAAREAVSMAITELKTVHKYPDNNYLLDMLHKALEAKP